MGRWSYSLPGGWWMLLTPETVVVADDLLIRLHLKVGDGLKIGTKVFRIASVVVNEPDRLSGSFASGPRVLMTHEGLQQAGLLAPGSRAGQRYLFKVPAPRGGAGISESKVAGLKARLESLLPEAQVTDYRETNPALTQGLDRATSLLSLMSLVALVLGAVGVCHGHESAFSPAAGYDRDHEVAGGEFRADRQDLFVTDVVAWAAGRVAGRGAWGGGATDAAGAAVEADQRGDDAASAMERGGDGTGGRGADDAAVYAAAAVGCARSATDPDFAAGGRGGR